MTRSGFTLIEVVVTGAVAIFLIMAALGQLSSAGGTQGSVMDKLNTRAILDQELSRAAGTPGNFPLVGSPPFSYVGCFNAQGVPVANKQAMNGYAGLFLVDATIPSGLCPASTMEVHISPSVTLSNQAAVNVIHLDAGGKMSQQYIVQLIFTPTL